MRAITVKIYEFSELSPKAKDWALDRHKEAHGYSWADEAIASLKALAKHFDGKLKDYEVDFFNSVPCSGADFDMPEMEPEQIEGLLMELGDFDPATGRGSGECRLTGYCSDEDAIDGFRIAWREGERDLGELMTAAFYSWLKAVQADCADQYSDEVFADYCSANELEFYEDGRPYRGKRISQTLVETSEVVTNG